MIPVVVLRGKNLNLTLASIKFSYWGSSTNTEITVVDTWEEVFLKYQTGLVLFVKSGTVFTDFVEFSNKINQYPHQGLIGHLVHKDGSCYLDDQCFLLDIEKFTSDDFLIEPHTMVNVVRSNQNIHHDYTPLWVKKDIGEHSQQGQFGTKLLDKHLRTNKVAVNWNHKFRNIKKFLYNDILVTEYLQTQKKYISMCQNQLWLLNNEPIILFNQDTFTGPASGLFWIFNFACTTTKTFDIVDISKPQLELAKNIWKNWNGLDYGNFVAYNIDTKLNFQVDDTSLSKVDFLKLKNRNRLANYLQSKFDALCPVDDFVEKWQQAKLTKRITFKNGDLLDYPLNGKVWASNISNFKYTLLTHSYEKVEEFAKWTETV